MTDRRQAPGATPSLGALDELDLDRRADADPAPAPPSRPLAPWLALAAAVLVLAAVALALAHWRDRLGQTLVPPSDLAVQLAAAQDALARGDLSQPDGSGARERFQAVLARDPDHSAARAGLVAVRDAALVQARAAIQAGDAATAHARIELARSLAAPAAEIAALDRDLVRLQGDEADLAALLRRAGEARDAGRLEQVPDGALALYSDVLSRWPGNALALQGRRDVLAALLRRAGEALDRHDLDGAEALVARVVAADPGHVDLPALQARLGEAGAGRESRQRRRLAEAADALRAGRLEAAAAASQAVLAETPGQRDARALLDDAAAAMAARAQRQAADAEFAAAAATLALAVSWSPGLPAVADAARAVEAMRAGAGEPAPVDPDAFARLLRQAEVAMRRGDLIDPPGESAWDRLRAAAAIDPDAPELAKAQAEYDRRARACFEDDLAGNRLSRAQACLDAMAARLPGAGLDEDRRRLANRWLAFAEERLGANELALAHRALQSAEAVDPGHPGLAAMAERLRRAGVN